MDRVKDHWTFVKLVLESRGVQRNAIIQSARREQIITLAEIAHNVLRGVFDLTEDEFSLLLKNRHYIRKFACKGVSIPEKKALFCQHGTRLVALLRIFVNHYTDQDERGGKAACVSPASQVRTNAESGESLLDFQRDELR